MNLLDFVVFHVGGKGGIGETINILKRGKSLLNKKKLFIFEADLNDEGDLKENKNYIKKLKKRHGIDVSILQYCISDHIGVENFYINKDRWSSSLFEIDPRSTSYRMESPDGSLWRNNCSVNEVRKVNVTTFDNIIKNDLNVDPDFLSMDAQASEFYILKGSKCFLEGDLLGVITEVEFREIYKNQPLFADQDILLRSNNFIFIDLLTSQSWFIENGIGNGFLTVGEVLYLKDYMFLINRYESDLNKLIPILFKLSIISKSLGYPFYSYLIIDYMFKRWNKECETYVNEGKDFVVKGIFDFYKEVCK